MSYKKVFFLSLTALSILTSCNKDKKNTSSSTPANQDITLRVSWWGGDDRHKKTIEALKLFEEKHPNIKIKSEYGGWQGWQEKITTQMAGNIAPDLMQINWNWIDIFSKNGDGFYNLNDLSDHIDLNQYDKNILEQCAVNDKLNAIPYGVAGRVFLYNKTTYDKAGLPLPKSFQDIVTSTQIMKEKLGADHFGFESDYYGALLLMLYKLEQETGKPFIVDNKVAYTQQELENAANFYLNLVNTKTIPSLEDRAAAGNIQLDQHPSWIVGKFGGTYEWDSASLKWRDSLEDGQELVVGEYPTDFGPHKSGFSKVSMALAINKNTKYPKETAELLNFLISDPEAVKILGVSRGIPANNSAVATLKDANLLDPFILDANNKVINFAGKGIHPLFEHKQLHVALKDIVDKLGYKQLSPEDASNQIINVTNEFLKENN